MHITSKGQVTIPAHIREKAGLLPNTEVEFIYENGIVQLVKAESLPEKSRGQAMVDALGRGAKPRMSTDEIMALTRGE